jgi:hypothetical protein
MLDERGSNSTGPTSEPEADKIEFRPRVPSVSPAGETVRRLGAWSGAVHLLSQFLGGLGIRSESRRESILAASGSVLIHLLLLLLLLFLVLWSSRPGPGARGRTLETALVNAEVGDLDGGWEVEGASTLELDVVAAAVAETSAAGEMGVDGAGPTADHASLGEPAGSAGGEGVGQGLLSRLGDGRAGKSGRGSATFFGAPVGGKSVVFAIDRSGSMAGRRLDMAKRELLRCIDSLSVGQQFQVVFYNHGAGVLDLAGGRLATATSKNRAEAKRQINETLAAGGTNHLAALQAALVLGPEVVVLLTDAEAADPVLVSTVDRLNRPRRGAPRATIHVVQLLDCSPAERSKDRDNIQLLARNNGGTYRLVEATGGGGR